eukprot:GEZU01018644.1.p1 GENE.GEZU01018644.1~~GEZU01018644.1.p1  ORF type:complete len:199 (+),score=34.60 GEZU01018644.1:22-618(+)
MLQRSKAFTKAARGLLTKITTSNTAKNVRFAHGCCHHYFPSEIEGEGDYAFEIHANSFKFGSGVLREVGEDAKELGLKNKRVALFTDRVLSKMEPVATAKQALQKAGCDVVVYDEIQVEPTDKSFKNASRFAIEGKFDGFVSVGGGSVSSSGASLPFALYIYSLLSLSLYHSASLLSLSSSSSSSSPDIFMPVMALAR